MLAHLRNTHLVGSHRQEEANLDIQLIQQAFAIAQKCSEQPEIAERERNYFRAIATYIEQATPAPTTKAVN